MGSPGIVSGLTLGRLTGLWATQGVRVSAPQVAGSGLPQRNCPRTMSRYILQAAEVDLYG